MKDSEWQNYISKDMDGKVFNFCIMIYCNYLRAARSAKSMSSLNKDQHLLITICSLQKH